MSDTTDDFRGLCGDACHAALMHPAPARRVMVSLCEDDLMFLLREFPGCTPSQSVEAVIDAWLIERLVHSLERARARLARGNI